MEHLENLQSIADANFNTTGVPLEKIGGIQADPTNAWLRGIVRDEVRRIEGTLPL